jgi:hypothetical protein
MQISGTDCYDMPMDIFADLDAGKAVILHFYMPDCGSCPPVAQKIETMANNILATYPGMITAYAFPFQNSTTCDYSVSWVEDNGIDLYQPMDSGATAVAYYGGFGMPTVVLLGGTDHRTMFTTLSFVNSDTTEMRDSILGLMAGPTALNEITSAISELNVFPNPANEQIEVSATLNQDASVQIELMDVTGKIISVLNKEQNPAGIVHHVFETALLPNGIYMIKLSASDQSTFRKIVIAH